MAPKWTILVIVLTIINSGVGEEPTFGDCQPNQTCTECYHKLKESLLKRDVNVRALSVAFFPPKHNIPEFVKVTYCFNENCNSSRIWYWTHDSSYLFFPLETFQYLSLFFGKPASLFSRSVTLILDEECHRATTDMFNLLTQRLKNFIQRASFDPVIDSNYFARAEENDQDILTPPTAKYILSFYAIGFFLALVIALVLLFIYLNTKRWDNKLKKRSTTTKANKFTQSKIFSIAATTFLINLYELTLDGFAVYTLEKGNVTIKEHYVNALPKVVTAIDIAGALFWLTCWTLTFYSWIRGVCHNEDDQPFRCKNNEYLFLAASTFGPLLTIVIHLPYIAIAYLNDAAYATSIFIYYIITLFVLFGILDLTYGTCQGTLIYAKKKRGNVVRRKEEGCYRWCPNHDSDIRALFICAIPTFAFVILVLAGMITALLVVIPISKAFSDVPNRLIGFYQSAIVLVGAYLVYRNFFKKKPSIESAVKDREEYIPTKETTSNEHWRQLSKDEKMAEFYSRFVDIVAKYPIEEAEGEEGDGNEGDGGGREGEDGSGEEGAGGEEKDGGAGGDGDRGEAGAGGRGAGIGGRGGQTTTGGEEAGGGETGTGAGAESLSTAGGDGDQKDDETTPLIKV